MFSACLWHFPFHQAIVSYCVICSRALTLRTTSEPESIDVDHTGMGSSLIAQANELDSF